MDAQRLEVFLVSPVALEPQLPNKTIEFNFLVRNRTSQELTSLNVIADCKCNIVQNLPATLAPYAQAEFSVKARAPDVGTLRKPLRIDSRQGILWNGEVAVDSSAKPPILLSPSSRQLMAFVNGIADAKSIIFKTVEPNDSVPWIESVFIESGAGLTLTGPEITTSVNSATHSLQRQYTYNIRADGADANLTRAVLRVETSSETSIDPITLDIKMLPSLEFTPQQIQIPSQEGGEAQVLLISRGRTDLGRIKALPCHGFIIKRLDRGANPRMAKFQVVLGQSERHDSSISFALDDQIVCEVPLEVESSR